MVFQNFTLIPALSVLENVALFLNDLPAVVPTAEILRRIRSHADRFRLAVDPWAPVRQLAVGDRQKVEILKQILAGARVLILDEPTKVLAPQESEGLFATMAQLRAEGYGLVLITHKLREVLAHADRIAVMRQGRIVGTVNRRDASEDRLLTLMFGEPVSPENRPRRPAASADRDWALELDGVCTAGGRGETALRDLSLKIRAGEIVGVAGVSGNGQRALGDLVLGLRSPDTGIKRLWGEDASRWSVAKVRERGVASIPDDPLALACVPGMTVRENLALGTSRRYRTGPRDRLAEARSRHAADIYATAISPPAVRRPRRDAVRRQSSAGRARARTCSRSQADRRALSDPRPRCAQHQYGARAARCRPRCRCRRADHVGRPRRVVRRSATA